MRSIGGGRFSSSFTPRKFGGWICPGESQAIVSMESDFGASDRTPSATTARSQLDRHPGKPNRLESSVPAWSNTGAISLATASLVKRCAGPTTTSVPTSDRV